jgi:hypothetical protein
MLAFVDLINALPTRGRKVPNSWGVLHQGKKNLEKCICSRKYPIHGEFCIKGRKIGRNAFVQGEPAFMHLGALFPLNFSCALLPIVW